MTLVSTNLLYYALIGFAAALAASVWMFRDSRNNFIDDSWISFVSTLGPLVTVAGAALALSQLLGNPLLGADRADIMRSLLWLSTGGGAATVLSSLYYALGVRSSSPEGNWDDIGDKTVFDDGSPDILDDTPSMEETIPPGQPAGGGYVFSQGETADTVIIRREGEVEGVIAWLTHLTDPHRGTEIPLGRDAFIGRESDCEIVLDDPEASGRHARLQLSDDGSFVLRDVGSTNGTYVNGDRIDVHTLSDHDTILIGATQLEFFWVKQRSEVPGDLAYRATMLISTGEHRGDTVALNQDKLLVGSSHRCDVCLKDAGVSDVHAVLSRDGDDYVISTIGDGVVLVNGDAVDEHTLSDRDEVVLGEARMLYRDGMSD